jgi:hypothetical protein
MNSIFPEFDLSPTPLLRGEGLKTLIFSCSSISFQEREVGRERFIELTLICNKNSHKNYEHSKYQRSISIGS